MDKSDGCRSKKQQNLMSIVIEINREKKTNNIIVINVEKKLQKQKSKNLGI